MAGGKAAFKEPEKNVGNYIIEKTIGQGTYGKVKLAHHVQTKEKVAIKVIDKATIENDRQVKRIQKEIRFLKLLYHPNIVKIYDVLETETHIFMVMEYASGGELFDYIVAHKRVKEKEARVFFRQIVSALDYCHTNSVIHRDLKPENLLLDDQKNIKIIDFGFSNTFQPNHLLNTFCGSPFYAAPEMILGKRYEGPEVDIWSLGVILFALLCGHLPFDDDDVKELYRKISSASYVTPSYLTESSKDLISRMITVHPKKRATLQEVKSHPWTNDGHDGPPDNFIPVRQTFGPSELEQDIVEKLTSFGYSKDDLVKPPEEGQPNAVRSTYYLVQEMFRREEEKFKKLRDQPRIDTTGRSNLDILGAITEDGAEELDVEAELPSITIPSSPGLTSTSAPYMAPSPQRYSKILDDFSRPTTQSPTPGAEVASARGRRASTSSASSSLTSTKAPPLFPNKNLSSGAAAAIASTSTSSPSVAPAAVATGSGGSEEPKPRGRRLSLPAIEYSSKKRNSLSSTEGEVIPGIPGRIRTLSGWFSVSTTSSKPPLELIAEVTRVLDANELIFEYDGSYSFVCEDDKKNPVAFEVEICKVNKMALLGLHLKRVRGSIWAYKKICNKILAGLSL